MVRRLPVSLAATRRMWVAEVPRCLTIPRERLTHRTRHLPTEDTNIDASHAKDAAHRHAVQSVVSSWCDLLNRLAVRSRQTGNCGPFWPGERGSSEVHRSTAPPRKAQRRLRICTWRTLGHSLCGRGPATCSEWSPRVPGDLRGGERVRTIGFPNSRGPAANDAQNLRDDAGVADNGHASARIISAVALRPTMIRARKSP